MPPAFIQIAPFATETKISHFPTNCICGEALFFLSPNESFVMSKDSCAVFESVAGRSGSINKHWLLHKTFFG